MHWLPIVLVTAVIVATFVLMKMNAPRRSSSVLDVAFDASPSDSPDPLKYECKSALLTAAELSFFQVLRNAVPAELVVCPKIRVADILESTTGGQGAFNRISAKHFDFLICNHLDMSPVCAVELDDSSHQARVRRERDAFLEAACASAGLRLERIPAARSYALEQLRRLCEQPRMAEEHNAAGGPVRQNEAGTNEVCRKCGAPMSLKVGRSGALAGKSFWACTAYPKCRTVVPISTAEQE